MNRRTSISSRGMLVLLCAAAVLVSGCRSARREEPIAGPLQSVSSDVMRGRAVFMRKCHMCHPEGNGGLGPSLNDKPLPGFAIRTQVRHGFGAMPRFEDDTLSDEDLDRVVAYLKALRKHG